MAIVDCKFSVAESRKRGLFQTGLLGKPIPEIEAQIREGRLWLAGPHICQEYLGNIDEAQTHKKRDPAGKLWHFMGDRIRDEDGLWWYGGRAHRPSEDFDLEQKVYSFLKTSTCFIHRDEENRIHLSGDSIKSRKDEIQKEFPQIEFVHEARIYRERRYRSRIDRARSLR